MAHVRGRTIIACSHLPVLDRQVGNTSEFVGVVRYQGQAIAPGNSRDQQIVAADQAAGTLEMGSYSQASTDRALARAVRPGEDLECGGAPSMFRADRGLAAKLGSLAHHTAQAPAGIGRLQRC